jgi:hypothetical protein
MIALRNDYLLFEKDGICKPCCAETIAEQLFHGSGVNPEDLLKSSNTAVIYFKEERNTDKVNLDEFCDVLVAALTELGYEVERPDKSEVEKE